MGTCLRNVSVYIHVPKLWFKKGGSALITKSLYISQVSLNLFGLAETKYFYISNQANQTKGIIRHANKDLWECIKEIWVIC